MGRWSWFFLAGCAAIYTALSGFVPAWDDELYYWCWSKDWQWSYYDHPPMTALLIRASTSLLGDTLFAIRLPAILANLTVAAVLLWLTRPKRILWGALLSPIFTFGAVLITPDTPLLLFWSLYLAWLVKVQEKLAGSDAGWWWWSLGGLLLGCGILGKYTAGLAVPAGLASFALIGPGSLRRWMPGYFLHLAVAFVASAPILIHNVREQFVPLLYQLGHVASSDGAGWKSFGEFLGIQALLVGTLPLVLLPWVLWKAKAFLVEPRLRVCACLYALPMLFFLAKAARGPLEGNWAIVSYLAFWPIAAEWCTAIRSLNWKSRWLLTWGTRLSFLPPVFSIAALGTHIAHPLPVIPATSDRISHVRARHELFDEIADVLKTRPEGVPVFTDAYQNAAVLRFAGVPVQQEAGLARPSHFTQVPQRMNDHGCVWYLAPEPAEDRKDAAGVRGAFADHVDGFAYRRLLAEFPMVTRGHEEFRYRLYEYRKAGR